ncbi:MAG: helix-turn-helix domain-containing protein [Hyphomonadaceae bacterium]|nr:helix-turn-helix domain-containing protein [Hyphomonadaceae bacterium]
MSNSAAPPPADDPKRARLLDAAMGVFARYGFRRASMADIAAAAGVSRPALYLSFRSKQDVLRALAMRLRDEAMAAAAGAWRPGAAFAENLEATLLGKEMAFFALLRGSPHGKDLLAVDEALTAETARDLDRAFRGLIAARARDAAAAGEIDLALQEGDAEGFAAVIAAAVKALMHEAADEAAFRAAVRRLCRMAAASVEA